MAGRLIYEGKERHIDAEYTDPLELLWVDVARRCGLSVCRSPEVFAWWNGEGMLALSTQPDMDPDDNVGQMIFHEICHALVAGPDKWTTEDWGLPLMEAGDYVEEHAAIRLQVALATPHGLRGFFGATTVFRLYYDALPEDAMQGPDDGCLELAHDALQRATEGPWAAHIQDGLRRTAALHQALDGLAPPSSLWSR